MNVLDVLGVDSLALRGKGPEFNTFSRFFKTKEEALEAVADGDYVPTPGVNNAVLILGVGIMVWSFDLHDFVDITELAAADNQASKYIELDGANDFIEFPTRTNGSQDALDWSKDWSIGITFLGLLPYSDNKFMSLFRSGSNHITLRRGGSNWGMYVTSNNNAYQHGANTGHAPSDTDRVLFTYSASTNRLKYYLGNAASGSYLMAANLLVNATVRGANSPGAELNIGKGGVGSGVFEILHWDGGVNNLIVSDQVLVGPQIDEYFQTQDQFPEHEYYPDLTSYCRLGEDVYPAVEDDKGNMTGGELKNGAPDDFKNVPVVEETP